MTRAEKILKELKEAEVRSLSDFSKEAQEIINSLTDMEAFTVVNDYLKIRVASGVRGFRDNPARSVVNRSAKKDIKTVEKALKHLKAQRSRTVKKPFSG